jgi:hypothetical protein
LENFFGSVRANELREKESCGDQEFFRSSSK